MKLSEAGLLGNMSVEVGRGYLMQGGQACFLGGALLGIGVIKLGTMTIKEEEEVYVTLKRIWPILELGTPQHLCYLYNGRVMGLIWHLNDTLCYTRPRIADIVKQIERYYTPYIPEASVSSIVEEQIPALVGK
jgi:hypothetical protein